MSAPLYPLSDQSPDDEGTALDDSPLKIRPLTQFMRASMYARSPEPRSPRLLPPIVIDGDGSSAGRHSPAPWKSPQTQSPTNNKLWSRYHSGCVVRDSQYMDWSSLKTNRRSPKNGKDGTQKVRGNPVTALKVERKLKDPNEVEMAEYLDANREFLEAYLIERVPIEDLERWVAKKAQICGEASEYSHIDLLCNVQTERKNPSRFYKYKNRKGSNFQAFTELLKTLQDDPSEHSVLWEIARSITISVGVDAFRVYKFYPEHPDFLQCFDMEQTRFPFESHPPRRLVRADADQTRLIKLVAERGATLRMKREDDPKRFPNTPHGLFRIFRIKNVKEANHVMYQPILTPTGKTAFVIEMWRIRHQFKDIDEEISSNHQLWGSLALHYHNLYLDKNRERNMNDFLLDVVKAIFEEMVSLDQLIKKILEFAQRLVNADRASLFLVDYRNFELVSTVFDLKFEPGQNVDVEKKEIRMPINRGIAGHVALSGETMNIPDAYSDYRFNRAVDEATGYKTMNILCMPVKVQGRVIGVVQMVNKRTEENFDHEDEVSFEIFSTFFGLALHHARLYDRIMRKEQKYRVALEVLSYHNTCRENEVHAVLGDKEPISLNLNNFYLDPYRFNEFEKCKMVITMFNELFDLTNFDVMTVTRFVLTVKKNYRTVPYHNFDHGWSVAHSMYVMLKSDMKERFDYKMKLALFVASLCHDLDHRGYTNKYMSETASPLAAMYTTSTLEHHHFNITVTILQQDGHNIFSHMSSEEYKEILGYIRQSILATDLAAFFPNLEKMKELHSGRAVPSGFSWSIQSHRELAMAISMTAADLSASAKPWGVQLKTVKVIFEEFYDQGDKERAAGKTPIPMMDRSKPEEQPASQVGFLSQICIPCYSMLYKILPNTKPMYAMALMNLDKWKSRAARILNELEYIKNNGQTKEDTEEQDSSIEASELDDIEPELTELQIEEDTKDVEIKEKTKDVIVRRGSKIMFKTIRPGLELWEEDDAVVGEERVGSGLLKDIEGVAWLDEEAVADKAKLTLDEIAGNSERFDDFEKKEN